MTEHHRGFFLGLSVALVGVVVTVVADRILDEKATPRTYAVVILSLLVVALAAYAYGRRRPSEPPVQVERIETKRPDETRVQHLLGMNSEEVIGTVLGWIFLFWLLFG